MAGYLGLPRERVHTVPLGISLEGTTPARAAAPDGRSRSATSRASRRRRACTSWPRPTAILRRERGLAAVAPARPPATWRPSTRATCARSRRTCAAGGSRDEFHYAGDAGPRRQDRVPPAARRALRAQPVRRSRRASTCSRRWPTACPGCSRGTARSRRCSRRRAAACCSSPDDADDLARQAPGARRAIRERAARARPARAPTGVRAPLHRRADGGARRSRSTRALAASRPSARARPRPGRDDAAARRRRPPQGLPDAARAAARPRRRLVHARARRVAVRHGPVGQRQEHAAQHPGRAGAADRGHGHARRPRSLRACREKRAGRLPQPARRLRVPGPLPAARSARCSRTCWCPRWSRRPARRARRGRRELLEAVGPRRAARPPAGRALGRREAARGPGARARPAAARSCCATSPPATSTRAPPTRCRPAARAARAAADDPGARDPQRRAGRALPRPRAGSGRPARPAPDRHARARSCCAACATTGGTQRGGRRSAWPPRWRSWPARCWSASPCARACARWPSPGWDATEHALTAPRFFPRTLAATLAAQRAAAGTAPLVAPEGRGRARGQRTPRRARRGLRRRRALLGVARRSPPPALADRRPRCRAALAAELAAADGEALLLRVERRRTSRRVAVRPPGRPGRTLRLARGPVLARGRAGRVLARLRPAGGARDLRAAAGCCSARWPSAGARQRGAARAPGDGDPGAAPRARRDARGPRPAAAAASPRRTRWRSRARPACLATRWSARRREAAAAAGLRDVAGADLPRQRHPRRRPRGAVLAGRRPRPRSAARASPGTDAPPERPGPRTSGRRARSGRARRATA